ncbi:MAG: hypothetical protein H9535_19685 [Ignavibacteria bacterium]|nr:hypothetical protein [Ignavibacteria bacterium]
MNNYNNRSITSNDPRYLQRNRFDGGMQPNAADNNAEEQMKRRRNQVRDALNRTKDVGKIEKIAEILRV